MDYRSRITIEPGKRGGKPCYAVCVSPCTTCWKCWRKA
jgi:hypothetical protein